MPLFSPTILDTKYYVGQILTRYRKIVENFGNINLNDFKLRILTEDIPPNFLKIFKIQANPNKYTDSKFNYAVASLSGVTLSLGVNLPLPQ